MKKEKSSGAVGRPREFDPEQALDTAMALFWKNGYEGTSLTDLTEAMGINRPSLYAAFGNKEQLFRKALDRYSSVAADCGMKARSCPCIREAVAQLLYGAADTLADPEHPGCFSIVTALACSDESEPIRVELCAARNSALDAWKERFEQAKAEGALPSDANPEALARYLMTVMNGMTVQARSGASREDLRGVAEIALRSWPGPSEPS